MSADDSEKENNTEEAHKEEALGEDTSEEEQLPEIAPSPKKARCKELLDQMSLEQKVGQLFVVRVESSAGIMLGTNGAKGVYTRLSDAMKEFLAEYPPGGYALFADNISNPQQLEALVEELKDSVPVEPILCIDEEGGQVSRLGSNYSFDVERIGNMAGIGSTGDTRKARDAGRTIGSYLKKYGFTLDLAPVSDVNSNPANVVIGNRSFGSDPYLVSDMVDAFLDGLHEEGVGGCLKHFPGHGDTKGDTHKGTVKVEKTWDELKDCELIPFEQNLDKADAVMAAHIMLPNVTTDGLPASLSKELITDRLRGELGFDGLVITDALAMGAVVNDYGSADAAVLAVEAGVDLLLMPRDYETAYNAVLDAVNSGRISEERLDESVMRILMFKDKER